MTLKTIFTVLICLLCFSMNAQDEQRYMVRHIKFKKGTADKAMELGMKFLNGAAEKMGDKVKVFRFRTGYWDALVMHPLQKEDKIGDLIFNDDPTPWQEMIKIAGGSEEKLLEELSPYWESVEKEEISFSTQVSKY